MTRNLLLVAIRFLVRQKVNTIIKIGGLAVGFTCCLLALLYVHFENSYDSFHKKSANIFRVVEDVTLPNGTTPVAASRGPVGPTMVHEIGEVLRSVRLTSASMLMKFGENHFQEDNVYFADSTIFHIFSFPILKGDPQTALTKPRSIVLTRKTALRYFGNSDPMGQEMMIDNQIPFTVTGIIEDVPGNSHLQFDILLSMSTRGEQFLNTWTWVAFTYIEIDDPKNINVLQQKLSQFGINHKTEMLSGGEIDRTLSLQPLNDIHLYSKRTGEAGTPGNASDLLLFSVVAGLVLLIACVNFINLTTAQASNRAREVGIRKVIGGTRIHLVNQFMIESILLSIAASLVAFGMARLLLPAFVQLTGSPLSFDVLYTIPALAVYFLISIVVGCFAGWYPALVLSGFRPAHALKGSFKMSSSGVLREGLIVAQFSIAIALVVGTIAVFSQLSYMQNKELGYDKEQVLVLYFGDDSDVQAQTETIKQELLRSPQLAGAAASSHIPGTTPGRVRTEFTSSDGELRPADVGLLAVDRDFISFYNIPLVAGRNFSAGVPDDAAGFLINESAVGQFGFTKAEDVLDRELTVRGQMGKVIGVIKDVHYASLHQAIEPMVIRMRSKSLAYFSLKVDPGAAATLVPALNEQWKQLAPTRPFDYFFLDEQFNRQYNSDKQFGQLFATAATVSIVLACLGLFALVSFIVEQRTKEIGVRKVLGASITSVVTLLSMSFAKLVLIAVVIASAVSWYAMDVWLESFPYRIGMQWWMFAAAGGMGLTVALLTVGVKSVRAAMANPVDALRKE